MSAVKTEPGSDFGHSPPGRRAGGFRTWKIGGGLVVLLIVLAGGLIVERKPIAAFLVQNYLLRHGVVATVEFDRLARGGFAARVRTPEFTAEVVGVTLTYGSTFAIPALGAVRLVRPVLHARFDGTRLSFGSLQPLVDEALAKEPERPGPNVTVENGTFVVAAPEGTLQFAVDAYIADGALRSLSAKVSPAQLRGPAYEAEIVGGTFSAKTNNGAVDVTADIALRKANLKRDVTADARDVALSVDVTGLQWRKSGGDVAFTAASGAIASRAAAVRLMNMTVAAARSQAAFRNLAGTYADGGIRGAAQIDVTGGADNMRLISQSMSKPSIRATFMSAQFGFGPDDVSIAGALRLVVDAAEARVLGQNEISLRSAHGEFSGTAKITASGFDGTIQGSLTGAAAMSRRVARDFVANIPVISADPALSDAVVGAIASVEVKVPKVRVTRSESGTRVALLAGASFSGLGNAHLLVTGQTGRPLAEVGDNSVDGGFGVSVGGGGLPELDLTVASYRADTHRAQVSWTASTRFEAKLDVAGLRGIHVKGGGEIASRGGHLTLVLPQCADVQLLSYRGDKGALLTDANVRVCGEADRQLLESDERGWQVASRLVGVSARLEQAQSMVADGSGTLRLAGGEHGLRSGRVQVDRALVSDAASATRFRPVSLSGAMDLSGDDWRGTFALEARGRSIASVAAHHNMRDGSGDAVITAKDVTFDPASLQPGDLSPLLANFATRVRGKISLSGEVRWTPEQLDSSGHVRLAALDFQSRLGRVRQTNGDLTLSSLIPVTLAPHQTVTMQSVDSLLPLEQAQLKFSLTPAEIMLEYASANVAGGRVSLDPEHFVFAPQSTTQGMLRLEHVDPTPLLAMAGLADRIKMQARVQGVVPFTSGPGGLRFANGHIAAEGPGRLSVQREAVSASVGTSGNMAAQPAAVQDFAYQALENLAFDQLTGDVNSLPEGRLGILLHVKGVHDPAEAMETRVGVSELLQGRAFDKPLPLPKGTPIDLTLDTSLNLDELLASYFGTIGGAAMAAP